jgi:MEMO1 family protein
MSIASLLFLSAFAASARAVDIPAQVAGQFYPANPKALAERVDGLLAAASTAPVDSGELFALLAPHAGYDYSGPVAAEAFRLLKGRSYPLVVVVGTGHNVPIGGAATVLSGTFSTPLGEIAIDASAVADLKKREPLVVEDLQAYQGEHSIEVELPFLQRTLGSFKLVPLLMNTDDPDKCRRVGEALAALLGKRKALLVVSSDLSHYPEARLARLVDRTSLQTLVETTDSPEVFWRTNRYLLDASRSPALVCTECGEAGVLAAQYAMKELGGRGRLLKYSNSSETPGGTPGRVVGYGAVAWLKGTPPARPLLTEAERTALLKAARAALESKLAHDQDPKSALSPDPELDVPAAVFVTLRRKDLPKESSLRGCIGSLEPDLPLIDAVRLHAVQSALEDTRFAPVQASELGQISIEISRLGSPHRVDSYEAVRPGQGVIARKGRHSGIFLPQVWEDIPDKAKFLSELCAQKAGLSSDCYKDPHTELDVFDAEPFEDK